MDSVTSHRWLLALWVCGIVGVTTLPWSGFQDHTHWANVNWVPFFGSGDNPRDVILNVVAFVPLGFLLARDQWFTRVLGLTGIVVTAVLLSSAVEFYQVFSHWRVPSVTDVVANLLGALGGAWLHIALAAKAP